MMPFHRLNNTPTGRKSRFLCNFLAQFTLHTLDHVPFLAYFSRLLFLLMKRQMLSDALLNFPSQYFDVKAERNEIFFVAAR
jgi:hypothetical protein